LVNGEWKNNVKEVPIKLSQFDQSQIVVKVNSVEEKNNFYDLTHI
jgi:hypothetical protein